MWLHTLKGVAEEHVPVGSMMSGRSVEDGNSTTLEDIGEVSP